MMAPPAPGRVSSSAALFGVARSLVQSPPILRQGRRPVSVSPPARPDGAPPTDAQKKELFDRLADHLAMLASELERAISRLFRYSTLNAAQTLSLHFAANRRNHGACPPSPAAGLSPWCTVQHGARGSSATSSAILRSGAR
jgi:hypothetical protein